jgi:hypothetical protein
MADRRASASRQSNDATRIDASNEHLKVVLVLVLKHKKARSDSLDRCANVLASACVALTASGR